MSIGKRIRELRKEKGILQKTLAYEIGVRQATVSRWEHTEQDPNPVQRMRLCKFFKISEVELFGGIPLSKVDLIRLPHFGPVSCASRTKPSDSPIKYIQLHSSIIPEKFAKEDIFVLTADGDCLFPEIRDGSELVFCRTRLEDVKNDDIVLVRTDNKITAKKIFKRPNYILLDPINKDDHTPITIKIDDKKKNRKLEVIGKLLLSINRYAK